MNKFRKKPVVIEATKFMGGFSYDEMTVEWDGFADVVKFSMAQLEIKTLEGIMLANIGDYIIQGVNGEFYPCKPDVFEKTYELVEEG